MKYPLFISSSSDFNMIKSGMKEGDAYLVFFLRWLIDRSRTCSHVLSGNVRLVCTGVLVVDVDDIHRSGGRRNDHGRTSYHCHKGDPNGRRRIHKYSFQIIMNIYIDN